MLKESEAARTVKLDKVIEELETFVRESKSASRRQEDETERLRDDIKNINDSIPKSMAVQKRFTDNRLKEISNEVTSLKSLISQRMNPAPTPAGPAATYNGSASAQLRPSSANAASVSPAATTPSSETKENGILNGEGSNALGEAQTSASTPTPSKQDYISSLGGRSSPFGSGAPAAKASIPSWQMAANNSKPAESAAGSA